MNEQFDLVVRGGLLADGRGGEPYAADVGITGGLVVELGDALGSGAEEIDATGLLVTPGFVDIHTHYDGQVTWENTLSPSSIHGVTTVVMGNCGVGFAPCKAEHRETLIKLMEGVEDIPGAVMAEGIPWDWESFPEFLDFLEHRECDIDFAVQVPHAPVRVYVMGKRGADREPPTPDELDAMKRIVQQGVAAGALGFSTSRTMIHRTKDGALAPTITTAENELTSIALGLREIDQGVLQMVDDFHGMTDDNSVDFDMWRRIVETSGRPLSFSLVQRLDAPERWQSLLHQVDLANSEGLKIIGQVCCRPIGLVFGLGLTTHPFYKCPSYQAIADRPLAERVEIMRQAEFRARVLAEEPDDPSPEMLLATRSVERMFEFTDPPNYSPSSKDRIGARAARLGVTPLELAYDLLLERDGKTMFLFPVGNFSDYTLEPALQMLKSQHTVLGIGDGGAHVGMICDASMTTHMLTYWTRDRDGERLPLGLAIKMLTRDTAAAVGLDDRGLIAPGYKADLNVIDYEHLTLNLPYPVNDLPAGGLRLTQIADGYVATVKSGIVTYNNGAHTGALPGRLIRGAQAAPLS